MYFDFEKLSNEDIEDLYELHNFNLDNERYFKSAYCIPLGIDVDYLGDCYSYNCYLCKIRGGHTCEFWSYRVRCK